MSLTYISLPLFLMSVSFFLQSQAYRSQPDLVSAVYDTTSSTLAGDYSYGQYPNAADASQNYNQYIYPPEYIADSTWVAPEQRKKSFCFKTVCAV